MILDIDPKNDFAFNCVFGSEHHKRVLIHMLNAVMKPPPERRVLSVDIVNPMTERVVLDEKLSILDVRARDQSGRQFNVETQMILHPCVQERFLYYSTKMYGSQLVAGENYGMLQPVVSICFLDGLLFPETQEYHLPFQLWNPEQKLLLSEHLTIHLFQLPYFRKTVQELTDPLDLWLYFLNNGKQLDPDNLPGPLRVPELEEAVGILKMVTLDEIRRAMYEDREKAIRDAASWRSALARAERRAAEAAAQATQAMIGQVRLCEQFLQRIPLPDERLQAMTVDELQQLVRELRGQFPH
jgi:predicted transposase/invertase (TIGR01784 family)